MVYSKTYEISKIILYDDPSSRTLDLNDIKGYLASKLGHPEIVIKKDFFTEYLDETDIGEYAKRIGWLKVRDINVRKFDFEPMYGEVEFEKKLLRCPEKGVSGILYDGFELMNIMQTMIPFNENSSDTLHIVFTNRLFGTFDENDLRYHARVIICGHPSIISTSGVVEAPAKPREFYRVKQRLAMTNHEVPVESIKEKFKGRFLEYDDARLTEVLKGYAMQAAFYHLIHEPFCDDARCRLLNAHWQEEMLGAQLSGEDLCPKHEAVLSTFRNR
jgi:hypothetical protein